MKYKTMKQYQEGGFFGRSRPLSTKRMLHKIGQRRDVKTAQEEFDEQFKKVKNKVGLLGIADMIIQGTSKTVLPPVIGDVVGSLTSDALKRSVPRVTTDDSPTGYLQSDFETLSEYEKLQGTDALNRALGKGASSVVKFAGDKVGGLKGIKDRLKLLNLESKPMPELTTGFGVASVPMGIAEKPLPFSLQNFLSKQLIGLEDLPINIPTESNQSTGLTQGNSSWDAGFGNFMASLGEEYQEGGEVDSDSLQQALAKIEFPAKTSKKYRLETLIDILNNPDLYGMNKKDSSLLDSSVKNEVDSDSLQQALAKKPMMDFFMRDFKDPMKKELKSSVMSGEVEPRDALQMLLNMQTADYLKSTGDTTNVLFDRLKEAGYQEGGGMMSDYYGGGMAKKKKKKKYGYMGGGLLDMMPYARRLV